MNSLLMYNPEGFLKYAKEFLKAPVSEQTLKEVRDVSTTRALRDAGFREFHEMALRAEQAVLLWLEGRFEKVEQNHGFPDFIAERDGKNFGFEVKVIQQARAIFPRIREVLYRAYYELKEGRFAEMTIVWVVGSPADSEEMKRIISRGRPEQMPDSLRMIIGSIDDPESGDGGFYPYEEFAYNRASPSF